LSTRRGRDRAAAEHFSAALSALQELPNAEASSVRLRRAQVLFDLYRCKYRSRRRREGPWESPEFVAAMAMLGTLLEERPDDPECLALQARCLREDARGPDGVAVHDEVVEIFRELATVHPERPEYRFEFCQAVLARARVRRGRGASTADLAAADALAEALVAEQPLFREYRSLLLRVRTRYASDVHRAAVDLDDDDRARQLALAYDRIRAALLVGEQAVQEDLRDLRYVASAIGGRGTLGSFLLTDGDREGALAQANLAMDLLERHVALQAAAQEAARGDGRASGRWKGTMRAELMRVDWEQSREFGTLLLKLNDKDLAARWRKLFSRR
jgi:hypothetical protein